MKDKDSVTKKTKTETMVFNYNHGLPNTLMNAMSWEDNTKPALDYYGDKFKDCTISVCADNKDAFLIELDGYQSWTVRWHENYGRYFARKNRDSIYEKKTETIKHRCKQDLLFGLYGPAITDCYEKEGQFWVENGEYASQVNFCPFCGEQAPASGKRGEN